MVWEYVALAPTAAGVASTAAMGKGLASAGSAFMKLAASGKSAAAAVTIFPQPVMPLSDAGAVHATHSVSQASVFSLHDVCAGALSRLAAVGEELGTDIVDTAAATWSAAAPLVSSSIPGALAEGMLFTGSVYGILKHMGYLDPNSDEEDAKEGEFELDGTTFTGLALTANAVLDALTVTSLIHTAGIPLTIPLRTWAVGGLLLGFPATSVVDDFCRHRTFKFAFLTELGLEVVSFVWLSWGTVLICRGSHAAVVASAPMLYYSCFGQMVFAWAFLSSGLCAMVLTTVAALTMGRRD